MSMKPQPIPEIPAETVRVVRAVFPKGNISIHLRDTLGTIYQDELFADLFPGRGQPAYAPWRLALVTVFGLDGESDGSASCRCRTQPLGLEILRCRLELTDAGFDHTVLSEFRTRLVALSAEERFLDAVIDLCKAQGWLKARGRQRIDSTHILAKVCALNRAECVLETLRHTLNVLAVVAPDWLGSQVQPEWLERYGHRAEEYRLPTSTEKRQALLHQVGQDGWGLLAAIQAEPSINWMLSIPAVDTDTSYLETRLLASRKSRDAGFVMKIDSRQRSSSIPHTIWMRRQGRNVQPIGLAIKCISARPVTRSCLG